MRITIPKNESLDRDVIREEFMEKYYPEMKTKELSFLSIFNPIGGWVRLQKNIAVVMYFRVKQDSENNVTRISLLEGSTKRAAVIGANIWAPFFRGDFSEDVLQKFSGWLMKKYNLRKEDVRLTEPWEKPLRVVGNLFLAALLVGIIFFIFDLINQFAWSRGNYDFNLPTGTRDRDLLLIPLMFAAAYYLSHRYSLRRKEKHCAKIERITGLEVQSEGAKWSMKKKILVALHVLIPIFVILGIFLNTYGSELDLYCLILFIGLFVIAFCSDFYLFVRWLFKLNKKSATILAWVNIVSLVYVIGVFAYSFWDVDNDYVEPTSPDSPLDSIYSEYSYDPETGEASLVNMDDSSYVSDSYYSDVDTAYSEENSYYESYDPYYDDYENDPVYAHNHFVKTLEMSVLLLFVLVLVSDIIYYFWWRSNRNSFLDEDSDDLDVVVVEESSSNRGEETIRN